MHLKIHSGLSLAFFSSYLLKNIDFWIFFFFFSKASPTDGVARLLVIRLFLKMIRKKEIYS